MIDWNSIIKYFISSGFIIAAIIFLAKKTLEYFSKAGIEKYKNELDNKTETFKAELQRLNAEHQIRFTELHKDRRIIIKNLYELLLKLEQHFFRLDKNLKKIDDISEDIVTLNKFYSDFINTFNNNSIYFNDKTTKLVNKVDVLVKGFQSTMALFCYMDQEQNESTDKYLKYANEYIEVSIQYMKQIREWLKKDFSKILGVNEN